MNEQSQIRTKPFTLYHHGTSVCAAKVRLAMAEKGLEWDGVYLDILAGDQFAPEYLALNPKAVVPTLVHGERIIRESTVIVEYLDKVYPETAMHPADPLDYAEARYWTKAVDEALHPACAALTFLCSHRHTIARLGPEGANKLLDATPSQSVTNDWKAKKRMYVEQGFDAPGADDSIRLYESYLYKMEKALADSDWLVGGRFGVADISLAPYVNRVAMLGMERVWSDGRMPRVEDWFKRLSARASFKPMLIDWIPEGLRNDLATNGRKSWPDVARILDIAP